MADDPLLAQPDGATPLETEELEALIPSYITLRGELNEAEQENILEAEEWAVARKRNVVNTGFLNTLHGKMFGKYWIEHDTYDPDEIAARFHHRLVYIHPYANGNGRHARLAADGHDYAPLLALVRS